MSEDGDQTWRHGFDQGQDDPYGQEHGSDALSALTPETGEDNAALPGKPDKAMPAKKQKSSNDKKQTRVIIGVAVVATIGWIGYGILEGKHANTANDEMTPAAYLHHPQGSSVPLQAVTGTGGASPSPIEKPISNTSPTSNVSPPATEAPEAPSAIPPITGGGALPMPMTGTVVSTPAAASAAVSSAATSAPADSATAPVPATVSSAPATLTSPVSSSASSTAMAGLERQIAQLKSRIAQETQQLDAEKSATAVPAPKVIYRVIYKNAPKTHTVPGSEAGAAPESHAVAGIHVIGAAQGTAWLSVQGRHMMVRVGDDVPGLGVVQSISDNGVVHGTHGTAQP